MRKSRVRELKRAFEARYGRSPNGMKATTVVAEGLVAYTPSERRRLRKAYWETRSEVR